MATNPSTLPENGGRIIAPDANYTYGSAKDDSTGSAGDGTPIKQALMNDSYGFQQWLLTQAAIVPSGNAETILASDFGDSLNVLFASLAGPNTFTGDMLLSSVSPRLDLLETDGSAAFNRSSFLQDTDILRLQSRDSAGVFISNDYTIDKDASGALRHAWLVGNVEQLFLNDTNLTFDVNVIAFNTNGPAVMNEASSSSNPTLVPSKVDLDTGLGRTSADVLAAIAGGSQRMNWAVGLTTSYNNIEGNISASGALMNETASSTNPTVVPAANDPDTGIGHTADDVLTAIAGGSRRMEWTSSTIVGYGDYRVDNSGGPLIKNAAASSTSPSVVPNRTDPNTGLSWNSADKGSLVAGGAEVASFSDSDGFEIAGDLDVLGNIKTEGFLNLGTETVLTISGGAITVTGSRHSIETQSGAAMDDLDQINGGVEGDVLIIRNNNNARVTTVRNAVGNIRHGASFSLTDTEDKIEFVRGATNWSAIGRLAN